MKPNAVSHGSYAFGLVGACGNTERNCARNPRSVMKRVHTANPPCAVRRWSVKPIRIDFTPSFVSKSNRTVWFAVLSTALVVLCFTPSTTPNGAPFGDYTVYCMIPAKGSSRPEAPGSAIISDHQRLTSAVFRLKQRNAGGGIRKPESQEAVFQSWFSGFRINFSLS